MNMVDRIGTFRGLPQDWGVSETKNGFPQFVIHLRATEYYDEEAGEWVDWSEYGQEITGYLVLFTKDRDGVWQELLNAKQIKKALGWTGLDFESLADGDYSETTVLFRVEENEFNGNTTLRISWLDAADASPTRELPKFDTGKLKAMTAKMGGALAATASTPAPATPAPAKAKGKPKPPAKGKPKPKKSDPTPAPSPSAAPPVSSAPKPGAPSKPKTATKESAWATVNEMKAKDVTDERLAEVWVQKASDIGKDESEFTGEDWHTVQEAVLDTLGVF